MTSARTDDDDTDSLDLIAADLRALREQAGQPSFAQIGARISADRQARGISPAAALPARTTVYDAFRDGRARVNPALVAEIVRALGQDDATVEAWRLRCARAASARGPRPVARTSAAAPRDSPAPPDSPAPTPLPPSGPAHHAQHPAPTSIPTGSPPRWTLLALLLVAAVALNELAHAAVVTLDLPLWLDMTGTAIVAIALGPWWGVGVGVASNVVGYIVNGVVSFPFVIVQIVGALLWGYGVRRLGMGASLPRYLALTLIVAVSCSVAAVPILLLVFHGGVGHGSESIANRVLEWDQSLWVAVGSSNLITSVADKLVTGFIALAVVPTLVSRLGLPATATLPPLR